MGCSDPNDIAWELRNLKAIFEAHERWLSPDAQVNTPWAVYAPKSQETLPQDYEEDREDKP